MAAWTTIHTEVELDADGRQTGYLHLPYSPHEDAWGAVAVPICVIRGGRGPTVLMTGGVHGDEYEGPLAYARLIRRLRPEELQGRLIIVPALNAPAAIAGRRVSPLDGRNMNRTYPGDPIGSETQQLSHYAENVLYPLADLVLDLHSGGSSLSFLPSTVIEPTDDAALQARIVEAVRVFGAPLAVKVAVEGDPRTSTQAAVRQGKPVIGSELGGSGVVDHATVGMAEQGILNVLAWLGMINPALRREAPTRILEVPGHAGRVLAPAPGVFEPAHVLGEAVRAGEVAGWMHALDEPWRDPVPAHYAADGIVWAHRAIGRSRRGSCLAVVAREGA